jgi:general secretion pathway protein H
MGARGFTLIEILVVIAIIAIAAGVVALTYDGDDRATAAREAKRFAGALEHASARAQWRAETLGVSATGSSWQFWQRRPDANRWMPIADDDVLAAHALPAGIAVNPLSFAGRALQGDAIIPLRASGHNEPFAFLVNARNSRIVLSADPLNRVTLRLDAEASSP